MGRLLIEAETSMAFVAYTSNAGQHYPVNRRDFGHTWRTEDEPIFLPGDPP